MTHRDILEELPLEVHNSHLITSLLHSLPGDPVLRPNYDTLDLSLDPYLEKNLEYLIDGMDEWSYEQGNLQYFQRQLGREHAKIAAWQAKRVLKLLSDSFVLDFLPFFHGICFTWLVLGGMGVTNFHIESGECDESSGWSTPFTRRRMDQTVQIAC
jgi:hypothetical protein